MDIALPLPSSMCLQRTLKAIKWMTLREEIWYLFMYLSQSHSPPHFSYLTLFRKESNKLISFIHVISCKDSHHIVIITYIVLLTHEHKIVP